MWQNELYGNLTPSEFKMGQDFGRNLGASIVNNPVTKDYLSTIVGGGTVCLLSTRNPLCLQTVLGGATASATKTWLNK
jgi:hypothetical protein